LQEAFCVASALVSQGEQTAAGRARKRLSGGGRKGPLGTTEQKLWLSLGYLQTDPRPALVGEIFGLSQSRANRWLQGLRPLVQQALEDLGVVPSREPAHVAEQERNSQEAAARIIDGPDRRRQRPQDPEQQAWPYRGKQQTQSDKNVGVVNAKTKRVGDLRQP
jgi:hypothetical protein